jgi:hypothetical protein
MPQCNMVSYPGTINPAVRTMPSAGEFGRRVRSPPIVLESLACFA